MAGLKLGNSEIKTYQDEYHGGMMLNYRYVDKVYLGNTLVWEDPDAPKLSEYLENSVVWTAEDLFPNNYSFKSTHEEVTPWPASGGTSEAYNIEYYIRLKCVYSNGVIHYFFDSKNSVSEYFQGTLYLDDVAQEKYDTIYSKYTIPENTKPCGRSYTIYKKSLNGDSGKKAFTDYQTSDEHALFGLTSDVYPGFNYSSARDYVTLSGSTYSISQAGNLVFRPLKRCQINFSRTGFYFYDEKNSTIQLMHSNLQNEIGLTSLPESLEDLDTDTFKNSGIKSLPQSLIIEPGKILLVGFLEEGTFWFSDIFSIDKSSVKIQAIGSSSPVKIIADDNVSWTAETTTSWLTLNKTSGKGSDTLTISATKNTSGSTRTGSVKISSAIQDLIVYVTQPNYAVALEFGTVPSTFSVTSLTDNTWEVSENSAHATRGQEFTVIPFTPTKNGTVGLTALVTMGLETCDVSTIGATISQNKTSYVPNEAITICDTDDSNTYSVIAGNTYYVQIYRADPATMEYAVAIQLSFNAS